MKDLIRKNLSGGLSRSLNSSGSLKRKNIATYEFIYNGNVPAGRYKSAIEEVKEVTTKKGFPALEVCYELTSLDNESLQPYKVKQIYPEGTQHYDILVDAMTKAIKATDEQEITFKDMLGVTEEVVVDYPNDNDWGTFTSRKPLKNTKIDVKATTKLNIKAKELLLNDEDEDDDDYLLNDDE